MLPARSGSKGLPDKNIKDLCGKPLMAYAMEALRNSQAFQKHHCYLLLNTDCESYAEIGRKYGAEVPFLRPAVLAGDDAKIADVISHTVRYFEDSGKKFDLFALIQITSPFLQSTDIDDAINAFEQDPSLDTMISVTESEVMPLWCNTLEPNRSMRQFIPEEIKQKNRQELPTYYRVTGSFRITRWERVVNQAVDWYAGNARAAVVDNANSLDIDTPVDFEYAEFLMKRR